MTTKTNTQLMSKLVSNSSGRQQSTGVMVDVCIYSWFNILPRSLNSSNIAHLQTESLPSWTGDQVGVISIIWLTVYFGYTNNNMPILTGVQITAAQIDRELSE